MRVSVYFCVISVFLYKSQISRSQSQPTRYNQCTCAINIVTHGLIVSLCLFSVRCWRIYSLCFPLFSFLSLCTLSGFTTLSERFALCKMATEAITRRKLNEQEQKISRNGLTFYEDILSNGHAGLQTNGRVQVRSSSSHAY